MVESIEEQIKKMCKTNLVLAKAIESVLRCCVGQHRIIGTLMLFAAGYVLNHNLHWKERLSQRRKASK